MNLQDVKVGMRVFFYSLGEKYLGTVQCVHDDDEEPSVCVLRDDEETGGGCDSTWTLDAEEIEQIIDGHQINKKSKIKALYKKFNTHTYA